MNWKTQGNLAIAGLLTGILIYIGIIVGIVWAVVHFVRKWW